MSTRFIRPTIFSVAILVMAVTVVRLLLPVSKEKLVWVVGENRKIGAINTDGRLVLEPAWERILAFDDFGLARAYSSASAQKGDEMFLIDKEGNTQSDIWEIMLPFDKHGMAAVYRDDYWGWIDSSGEEVISNEWDSAAMKFGFPFGTEADVWRQDSHSYAWPRFDPAGMARIKREKKGRLDR